MSDNSIGTQLRRLVATAQNGLEVIRLGGFETDVAPSPFRVVDRTPMYRLRRYFPDSDNVGPPVVLVPPMMVSAEVYDVTRDQGAVGILHAAGLDPWVVDFGSPETEEGGWDRTLADHVVSISDIVGTVSEHTGRDVHLAGYSQGGMFCYQAAAYRTSKNLASIITFGAPVDTLAALPLGIPAGVATRTAEFLADHVFTRLAVSGWMARTGFQLLDPAKTVKSRIDFLMQLHDRDALLPREQQRRFLAVDGWVAWSGPAVADLLKQFVVHNRMMTGGFVIDGKAVTLAELTVPILAFVGEVDDIGQPLAVRGIKRAAPRAEVFEAGLRAGHFGLVVGSTAAAQTWPTTAEWIRWREDLGPRPPGVVPMVHDIHADDSSGVSVTDRVLHTAASVVEVGVGIGRGVVAAAVGAVRGTREISSEAVRTLPRLARLGQLQQHSQVSFGRLVAEQARRSPHDECFVFDDRVYSYSAVDARIDRVVVGLIAHGVRPATRVGVLMETRPSGLAAVAALSRIGAVAVLMQPGSDLVRAAELGRVESVVVDPENLETATGLGCDLMVLGGGDHRPPATGPASVGVVDLEFFDHTSVELPAWYTPNPGLAGELAFIIFGVARGGMEARPITNYRWALSAYGTASAAGLGSGDTVYCLAPLHHSAGLLVAVGGALAGGSRIALSRGVDPERFASEVLRYGVTVVSYTWTMMRALVDSPSFPAAGTHSVRLLIGSGMPTGLWRQCLEKFAPAGVLEFYASTEGDIILANVSGAKVGSKGRPLPGSAKVAIAAYDPVTAKVEIQDDGFVQRSGFDQPGLLLARPGLDVDPSAAVMRGVFAPGDMWVPTDMMFRCDSDGDYWYLGNRHSVITARRGPVFPQSIADAIGVLEKVDLAVAYGVGPVGQQVAVCAVTLRCPDSHAGQTRGAVSLSAREITEAVGTLLPSERPDVVCVVPEIAVGSSFRPVISDLILQGIPRPGVRTWYFDPSSATYRRLTKAIVAERFAG